MSRKLPRSGPRRLGPPAEGELRLVTIGEATHAQISRRCLVCNGGPSGMSIFEPASTNERRYRELSGAALRAAIDGLKAYWGKR